MDVNNSATADPANAAGYATPVSGASGQNQTSGPPGPQIFSPPQDAANQGSANAVPPTNVSDQDSAGATQGTQADNQQPSGTTATAPTNAGANANETGAGSQNAGNTQGQPPAQAGAETPVEKLTRVQLLFPHYHDSTSLKA